LIAAVEREAKGFRTVFLKAISRGFGLKNELLGISTEIFKHILPVYGPIELGISLF
jgi:hypothetical protein